MFQTVFNSPSRTIHHEKSKVQSYHDHTHQLKLEAEKIRNWHVQTEINAKKMEKVVQNLRFTVESQRKSLLEVQLEYESVGNKMQEEINKRAFCLQKIDATRDMCNLLKTQACNLEKSLQLCDNVNDDLEYQQKKHDLDIEKLIADFQNLVQNHETAKMKLHEKLVECQDKSAEERSVMQNEIDHLKNEVLKYAESIEENETVKGVMLHSLTKVQNQLVEEIKAKDETNSVNKQLKKELNSLTLNCDNLQSVLEDNRTHLKCSENKLQLAKSKLDEAVVNCSDLEEKLRSCSIEIDNKNSIIEEQQKSLQSSNSSLDEMTKSYEEKVVELNASSEKLKLASAVSNDLKLQNFHLRLTIASKIKVSHLNDHKCHLLKKLAKFEKENSKQQNFIFQNKSVISQLFEDLSATKNDKEELERKVSFSSKEMQETNEQLNKSCDEINALKEQLQTALNAIEEFTSKLDSCHREEELLRSELQTEIAEKTKLNDAVIELKELNQRKGNEEINKFKEMEQLKEQYEILKRQFDDQSQTLKETKESLDVVIRNLQDEKDQVQKCQEEMEQDKAVIEKKSKSLAASASLYNELLIIRNDLTEEVKTLCRDLQTSKDKLVEEKQNNEKKIVEMRNEHKHSVEKLSNKIQAMKDKYAIMKEEAAAAQTQLSQRVQEKCSIQKPPFSPVCGNNISGNGDHSLSVSAMLSSVSKGLAVSKKAPPKHSTPIRRTPKPSKYMSSVMKSRSGKKVMWKRSASRAIGKGGNETKKSKDYNWYDTDSVYGFFD